MEEKRDCVELNHSPIVSLYMFASHQHQQALSYPSKVGFLGSTFSIKHMLEFLASSWYSTFINI